MTPARQRLLEGLAPVLVGLLLLAAWQAWCTLASVPEYLVPSPGRIARTLWTDRVLLADAWVATVKVALAALAFAVVLGTATAFVMVQSRALEASLMPYVILLQVTPIVAVAPLIILWVEDTFSALVACATIVALFPMVSNTTQGLRSVDRGLADYFRLCGASRWQTLVRLRAPSALPYFFAGLRVSSGLSLIGAVVAEFVAGTGGSASGLAYQILLAGLQLNIPRLFAALVLIAAAGVAFFSVASLLSRLALRHWHESAAR